MSMSNTTKRVKEIRIVLDGLRGESSIAELCRREGINSNLYYRWSNDFLEAGKMRLSGDTVREANSDEVVGLRKENTNLKQAVAELYLRNDWLKKSLTGQGVTLDED
jgi:transposase